MDETGFMVTRSAGFAAAAVLALALQRWRPHDRAQRRWRSGNLALWALNAALLGAVCGGCAFTAAAWARSADVGVLNRILVPDWLGVAAAILWLDLVSYLWHRANHRVTALWRFHQVHHSDATFSVSTAVRFHPGELLLSLPVRLGATVLLGAAPLGVVLFELLFALANFVEHGNIGLPGRLERRLGRLCITPALHRRHHSRRSGELNSNFGTVFSFWDRMLGTYGAADSTTRVDVGLQGVPATPRLRDSLLMPAHTPSLR